MTTSLIIEFNFLSECELLIYIWVRGAMDNASAYGAEDSRFESWRTQFFKKFIFKFF